MDGYRKRSYAAARQMAPPSPRNANGASQILTSETGSNFPGISRFGKPLCKYICVYVCRQIEIFHGDVTSWRLIY